MLRGIFNRGGFELPVDGWFQVAPRGEWPHEESGLVQVIDEVALAAMANRFASDPLKPLLVDFDHFSYDPAKSSEAAGWITEVQNRADGLWAKVKWTPDGEKALKEGKFRHISPVWLPAPGQIEKLDGRRIRPLRLDTAGLTNNPRLKGMMPLSNRGNEITGTAGVTTNKGQMKSVLTLLGLSADASEDAAREAVAELKNRAGSVETLTTEKSRLETENKKLLGDIVEQDLARFENRFKPEKREAWKSSLLSNRAGALELLESLEEAQPEEAKPGESGTQKAAAAAAPAKPMHNRAGAKAPASVTAGAADKATQQNNLVRAYMNREKVDFETAWNAVRSEKPELFKEEA